MRLLIPLYASTLFLSAFLLFSLQPMVGKFLLPLLGGGTSIWNTAMLFFQILLLGGYAYAHAMARFVPPRAQIWLHLALFAGAALSLPLSLPPGVSPDNNNPLIWQLGIMAAMAAAPFFILSSTAPLLQQWFSRTSHGKASNPYFLYAASNIGSVAALLSYPVLIEPLLRLNQQALSWSSGYAVLAVFLLACALASKFGPATQSTQTADDRSEVITWKRRATWLFLAFVPSSLMLGVTTYITSDITAVPLFWIIPLTLYLLSFIVAFSEKPYFTLATTRIVHVFFALILVFMMVFNGSMIIWSAAIIHLIFFFFTALLSHQELVALKPKASHLTEFFLIMSLGGALGGVFNSLVAPLLFVMPFEYLLVIALSMFCRFASDPAQPLPRIAVTRTIDYFKNFWDRTDWQVMSIIVLTLLAVSVESDVLRIACALIIPCILMTYYLRRLPFALLFLFIAIFNPMFSWESLFHGHAALRNYYGILYVTDMNKVRILTNGITNHGAQSLDPAQYKTPITYYSKFGGLGDAFAYLDKQPGPQNIAVLGMGTGTVACYPRSGRSFDFYEINPYVVQLASDPELFTYLSGCGSPYNVIMGDARHKIAEAADSSYDMIFVDVFSSDNIPMHVMTKEAVGIYLKKLKPRGILVFHISNRFFRLDRELAAIGATYGQDLYGKRANTRTGPEGYLHNPYMSLASYHVTMTNNPKIAASLIKSDPAWKKIEVEPDLRPWSDDYANILRSLMVHR